MIHTEQKGLPWYGKLLVFLTPLCLFVDPTNEILLHNVVGFEDDRIAYPVSIVTIALIPFLILYQQNKSAFRLLLFILLPLSLSIFHAILNETMEPILVSFTWMSPFIWLAGFLSLNRAPHDSYIVKWFCLGAIASTLYIFIGGSLEILIYGALQDEGRMSTNLVLPGHYQLYVYMPTMTAFSVLVTLSALRGKIFSLFRFDFVIVLAIGTIALVFMAAREAIISYIFGLLIIFVANTKLRLFVLAGGVPILGVFILANIDKIASFAGTSEIKSLRKFSQFNEAGQVYGSRDLAVLDYFDVFRNFPIFGTGFRSPFKNYFGILTEFPSAHNYYVDTMAWGGIALCVVIFPFIIFVLFRSISYFLACLNKPGYFVYYRGIFACLIITIIFSNNINVPFRAPLLAPLFGFLMFGVFGGSKFLVPQRSSGS